MNKYLLLNERLHLYSPNINICFRLVIEGILNKSNIEESLKKVSKIHPFINCSIEFDNDDVWLVQKNNSINIEYFDSSKISWEQWYKKTDNIPFIFSNNSLVKICVITGKNTEIVILGHHIIGDGIGYLNFIKDLISILDNHETNIHIKIPPVKSEDKYFKQTFLLSEETKHYAQWLNSEWKKEKIRFSKEKFYDFFNEYRKNFIPNLYLNCLEGEKFNNLIRKSKFLGLTVNEVISSTFSLAFLKNLNKKETCLGLAANIRNEIVSEPNECMGNYVTGISENINYLSKDNNTLSNIKLISSKLRKQLSDIKNKHMAVHFLNEFDKDLIESIMFAAYGNFNHPVAKKLAELMGENPKNKGLGISNLGKHHLCDYKNIKILDLQFIGPVFPANLLTIDIITVNNKLNFCLRYNENEINTDTIKEIYNEAVKLF